MTVYSQVEPEPSILERRLVDEGRLLDGVPGVLPVAELASRLAGRIAEHLERAAWWPDHEDRCSARLGEFSSYSIGFKSRDFRTLYVRVETEPFREATLEISASVDDPGLSATAPEAMKDALLRRGFRPGGFRDGFTRAQRLQSPEDCHTTADVIAGLMTDCLGYDSSRPASFKFDMHQRGQPEVVLDTLSLGDVARLLRSGGLVVWPQNSTRGVPGFRTVDRPQFELYPFLETANGSGLYTGLMFYFTARFAPESAKSILAALNRWYARGEVRAYEAGEIAIRQTIVISGGVTEAYVRKQLRFWRALMRLVVEVSRNAREDDDE